LERQGRGCGLQVAGCREQVTAISDQKNSG
jgi:hypothetical protein